MDMGKRNSQMNLEKSSLIQRWLGDSQLSSVRLSDCLTVGCHVTDQCIHITYASIRQSQPITFSHTEKETDRDRVRDRGRDEADSCLSGNVYFLPSAHPVPPRAPSYWVLPKTHLIISFCHNNRNMIFVRNHNLKAK